MGLSGIRMRSNLVPTSTARIVSILKFSRIWDGGGKKKKSRWKTLEVPTPVCHLPRGTASPACPQRDAHVHEEELHLQLGDAAAQALPGAEPEAQPLEVLGAGCQPALRAELLRLGEDLSVPAHGVETHLHQRLQGRVIESENHRNILIVESKHNNSSTKPPP